MEFTLVDHWISSGVSASLMVGQVVGQNTNTNNVDQASADVHLVEDENEDD